MQLEIMNGCYRKRKIKYANKNIRPTLSTIRKCFFDTIYHRYGNDYTFLDCFAGSGIMGIEALSRGCKEVVFFDKEGSICKQIESNLSQMVNITGLYHIIKCDTLKPPQGKYMDVIYLDPPYHQGFMMHKFLRRLFEAGWINQNTLLVLETHHKTVIPYEIMKTKTFGNAKITFLLFSPEILEQKIKMSKKYTSKFSKASGLDLPDKDFPDILL